MEKINHFEQRKAELNWLATSYFESDEELDSYLKECELVGSMLIQMKGGAQKLWNRKIQAI